MIAKAATRPRPTRGTGSYGTGQPKVIARKVTCSDGVTVEVSLERAQAAYGQGEDRRPEVAYMPK